MLYKRRARLMHGWQVSAINFHHLDAPGGKAAVSEIFTELFVLL